MNNSDEQNVSNDEKRRNMISGLGVGMALGVVFWSALNDLIPFPLDLVVGMATGLLVGYRVGKYPPMLMRYPTFIVRRLFMAGAFFVLGVIAYSYLLDLHLNGVNQALFSPVAIVPAIVFVSVIGSAIGHLDEMQRRIQTEGIAIAFAGTGIFVIAFVFLGLAGIPAPNWIWLLIVMTVMWLLGKLWTLWRYR